MFGKLNDLELPAPSSFEEAYEIIGGYNTTLSGTRRRNIKAMKKTWKISYSYLRTTVYDSIYAEFLKYIPVGLQTSESHATLTAYDARLGINNKSVHIDISPRILVPGTDLLSSVDLTFTEV